MTENAEKRRRCMERIQSVFKAVLDDGKISLSEELSLTQIPKWDPASHLAVVAGIEKAFSIRFTTREVGEAGKPTATIRSLIDIVLAKAEAASQSLRSSLEHAISENHRRQLLLLHAQEQLAAVLGIPVSGVDARRTFQDMGVTSLSAIELCSRLEMGLGISLSPSVVYNYPSIGQLVMNIAARLESSSGPRDLEAAGTAKETEQQ